MKPIVLLDFDGTLAYLDVDIDAVRRDLRSLFLARGVEREFSPILATIDEAAEEVGGTDGLRLRTEARERIDAAEIAAASAARPREGALDLLAELAVAAHYAVVTNNSRAAVQVALASMGGDGAVVVGRDDVVDPKPSPEGLHVAIDRLGANIGGGIVMVGDSPADIRAARAARLGREVLAIAVLGGRGSQRELEAESPHRVVGDLVELRVVLGALDVLAAQ